MRNSRMLGRVIALAAVVVAVAAVAVVLIGAGGTNYRVHAHFINASQIVKGDLVQVSGAAVGKVTDISLTDNGEAAIDLQITDGAYAPLREGTLATVRQASLSGVANRYIDLRLPPATPHQATIPNGGVLPQTSTTTAVDLDQLFNTFGPKTRQALTGVIHGFANQYVGKSAQANRGWLYLNPSLAATSRLFRELNYDTPLFARFVVASSKLVTDIAVRRNDLAGLIDHLATTTGAIGRQQQSLARAINELPPFMRRANTTFVNLRSTLDDLTPLVNESKPVAKKLRPFFAELRPLARDARPTLHDLSRLIKLAGPNNDLIELTRSAVPVRDVAIGPVQANGKSREGALPASVKALAGATPELAYGRPYATDLTGWFDDFGHSGLYDALGGASRAATHVNAFALVNGLLQPVPADLRNSAFSAVATLGQRNRCPGAAERNGTGKALKPSPDYPCDASQVPPGT